MSVLDYLSSGGMASIGGDLREEEQNHANSIVRRFANALRGYARTLQIPASNIKINKCSFLFVAKAMTFWRKKKSIVSSDRPLSSFKYCLAK